MLISFFWEVVHDSDKEKNNKSICVVNARRKERLEKSSCIIGDEFERLHP
jgi:hypothetical protein